MRENTEVVDGVDICDPWEAFNKLRLLCNSDSRLSVALELTERLPDLNIFKRWLGEPVKAVILPTSIFISDKFGRPRLPKLYRWFLDEIFCFFPQVQSNCSIASINADLIFSPCYLV